LRCFEQFVVYQEPKQIETGGRETDLPDTKKDIEDIRLVTEGEYAALLINLLSGGQPDCLYLYLTLSSAASKESSNSESLRIRGKGIHPPGR